MNKQQIKHLKFRKDFYKKKFEDKLSVNKEYQKLKNKFDNFLLLWIKEKKEYEIKIDKLEKLLKRQIRENTKEN